MIVFTDAQVFVVVIKGGEFHRNRLEAECKT